MVYSSDPEDYENYEWDPRRECYVDPDCRSMDPDDDLVLDLDWEYETFCHEYGHVFRDAPGFVCSGYSSDRYGIPGRSGPGGNVFTDISSPEDFLSRFAVGGQYDVRVDDENGALTVTTYHHDGHMVMNVRMLTPRGLAYCEKNADRMDRRELVETLFDSSAYSEDVNLLGRTIGSKNRRKAKKAPKRKLLSKSEKPMAGEGTVRPGNVHDWAMANMGKDEIATYHSDLYIKVTPVSKHMVENLWDGRYSKPSIFIDQIDREPWYEFPLCALGEYLQQKQSWGVY